MPHYYLIAVSTRHNLNLCIKHALAGFTNSINGIWAFVDIAEGDLVSFLYGAKVFNLYKVVRKEALANAEKLPPWPSIVFQRSGQEYYFPFRLHLEQLRSFEENLVRSEFLYVAENLFLRGGYAKTHFQADQTTLQSVSQMGVPSTAQVEPLEFSASSFSPRFAFTRSLVSVPQVFLFQENILHAVIKRYLLRPGNIEWFVGMTQVSSMPPDSLEVLGERALPEGHIDVLVKEAVPIGLARKIIIEVKKDKAALGDIDQLRGYVDETGIECEAGVLVSGGFSPTVLSKVMTEGLHAFSYSFAEIDRTQTYSFEDLCQRFRLAHMA